MERRHWLVEFFRWDTRAVLAAGLGLAVLIGLAMAATDTSLVISFDFGGASKADQALGATAVQGSLSIYPKTASGGLQYGWTTTGAVEFSDKSVSDKIDRDYNSGPDGLIFKIGGLDAGNYDFKARVGATQAKLSTKMKVGALATSVNSTAGVWQAASLVVPVDNSGEVQIVFSSANGADPWGICGLTIYRTSGALPEAGFVVSATPAQQTISAGATANFNIGLTAMNGYAAKVTPQLSGLAAGMTAEFAPANLTPPGVIGLTIKTTDSVPPTNYALILTLVGSDGNVVTKTVNLGLEVTVGTATLPTNTTIPELPPRTAAQARADFNKVDTFAAEQKVKIIQQNNFQDMQDIGDALSAAAPSYQALPEPTSTTESILQKLVTTGIIGTTTDAAPPVQAALPAPGFWQRLWQSVFKPAS